MGESSNGHSRLFGPHGEGCTCDEEPDGDALDHPRDGEATDEELGEEIEDPNEITEAEHRYTRSLDLAFHAVAECLTENFMSGLDAAAMNDEPLSRNQIIAMFSSLMRGYTDAKEAAQSIDERLKMLALHARAERFAILKRIQEEEEAETPLNNVEELFFTPPQAIDDEPEADE
jgi:hypothetical protein